MCVNSCWDLEQEVMWRLLRRLGKYDPCRSSPLTFAARVVDSILIDMWREATAKKRSPSKTGHARGGACGSRSLDSQDLPDQAESQSTWTSDLQIDVQEEIRKLPPELAPLAEDLLTLGVTEIAAKYALSRGTIHRKLQTLRRHWKDSPLRPYVLPSADD